MPLFLCGIVGLGILWLIARQFIDEPWMVGISLVMFAVSRPLMFTSVTARPDLLCAVFGWLVLLTMLHWTRAPKHGWLVVAGGLCGIGLLCHPFALVYCIQAGVWSVLASGALQVRIGRAIVLSVSALLMLGLWLPLILAFPYEFQSQFFCNVLERSGPGILSRMIWPWDSFDRHWKQQCEFNEVFQMAFLMSGLLGGTAISLFRKRGSAGFFYTCLAWTAVYFTATAAGIHPTKGYWVYAIGLIYPFAVLGHVQLLQLLNDIAIRLFTISPALRTSEETQHWYRGHSVRIALFSAGLLAIMLPHSGIKATFCYLQNWGDGRYHAGKFIAEVLERLPQEGLFMVDVNYVLDVYLTGRKTILCQPRTRFWGEEKLGIDYLIVGQEGLDGDWPNQYETTFFRREGNRSTEFDCFVEIYVPKPSPESPPRLD